MKILILLVLLMAPWSIRCQEAQIVYSECIELCVKEEFKKANRKLSKVNKKHLWRKNPELLYLEGVSKSNITRNNSKKNEKTVDIFSAYIEELPNSAKGYFRRGLTYLGMSDDNLALNDFEKCLELEPGFLFAYYYKAYAEQRKSSPDLLSAVVNYSKFIALVDSTHDFFGWAHFHRGLCKEKLNLYGASQDINFYPQEYKIPAFVHYTRLMDVDTLPSESSTPCLFLIPTIQKNTYQVDSIQIDEFKHLERLSSLIHLENVKSYSVIIIKTVAPINDSRDMVVQFSDSEDYFSKELIDYIEEYAELDDTIIFEKIISLDETGNEVRQASIHFKVKIYLCQQ